jgi:hypothetical protein
MSYLIIVGFNRQTNEPVTQSSLTHKIVQEISQGNTDNLCKWLKNDFGFFNESKYKEQIEEMYILLSATVPSMCLDADKTTWLKDYWIIDCLYSALSKCFPQLSMSDITKYQERWLEKIYSSQKIIWDLHPKLGTKGHAKIICNSCEKVTVPFKVLVNIPDLPLPKTPNYCPQCYDKDKTLYYVNLNGKTSSFKQNIKVHKL